MLFIYILLSVIAIGVLLISPAGQRLLQKIGVLGFILVIVCLVALLVIGGILLISNNWESIKELVVGLLTLVVVVIAWVTIFIIIPVQSNKMLGKWLSKPEDRKTFWAWLFIIVIGLLIYYFSSI